MSDGPLPSFALEGALARRGGRRLYESLLLTTSDGTKQRIRRGTTVLVRGSDDPSVALYVAYVREIMEGKGKNSEPELAVLYRPGESPRKLASTDTWGSAASPRELFFSSHMDTISAESLVHCAVVRFMPQPPAVAPTGGAGFFVARVYDPSSCNVHNLNSGNFRPEAFAAEISFIFEGPGKNRAASAGAAHSDAVAGTPKAAPKPAAPPQPAPKAAAAPEVIQKQRGAPPPEAHTVAATLRESLRRESTQAGRVRLLNQVATQSPHVRAVLASGDAAASIAAWMQLAIKQTPLGGGGGEAANALLAAALKALDALPLDRSTFAAQKGDSLMEAARTTASTPTVAPAQQQAAGALVLRWRGLVAAGDDAPSQEQSQSAAARAAAFGASPRSTEAAATLVGVARRASGAKTPVAASNGGGAATKTASVKRAAAPADSAGAPADDGDDAMVLPPPPKRAKGASPTAAAAGEARAEAAAVRAATAAIAAGGGVGVNSAHKRAAAEKVEDALTAVALALKLSRAARQALIHCDDPAAEMGTLVEGIETMHDAWTAPTR